ncbi:lysophospholipid acyltransferase family protein [Solicola gregarius]|uniref:1-acyl-sn-glycerol-3-phosphate acyltransferase n=1 Tax=Solicola gregarius TaxID=2908642 RepID=A0AA46TID8_9ACTN|nr:lysophospholipid acyltransferase family protein [Solicola gregarius]UYM05705.1 1-acyl-sn-glycerol-3-phosphate acyltransferase [Solicola gregarius]
MARDVRRRWRSIRVIGLFLRPILTVIVRRRWKGGENLPDGGFIFAVNHIAHIDPLMISHFLYDLDVSPRFLAKQALFDVPVLGWIMRVSGQIPVLRNTRSAAEAFAASEDAVSEGGCVIFYPEGTISRDPDLWPMRGKSGAARVALETGCPLVPVAQWGSHEVLYPYTKRPHLIPRKTIRITMGAPLALDDLRAQPVTAATVREATDRLMREISRLLGEIREATPPADPYDPAAHKRDDRQDPEQRES